MDGLHAAIAAFLRSQRPAPPSDAPKPPAPRVRRERVFACRFCAARVWEGEHGAAFHFAELWEAVSCEACHRERVRLEAHPGGVGTVLRQSWHRAAVVRPRCRKCGEVIDAGDARHTIAELRAVRECADCYMPS